MSVSPGSLPSPAPAGTLAPATADGAVLQFGGPGVHTVGARQHALLDQASEGRSVIGTPRDVDYVCIAFATDATRRRH